MANMVGYKQPESHGRKVPICGRRILGKQTKLQKEFGQLN